MSLKSKIMGFFFNTIDKHVLKTEPFEVTPDVDEILKKEIGIDDNEPQGIPPYSEQEFDDWNPKECFPYYRIKGEGHAWFLDPARQVMVKTKLGSMVLKLSEHKDKQGRVLVYMPDVCLVVPPEDLIEIGYN